MKYLLYAVGAMLLPAGTLLAQAPSPRCCEMKVVSAQDNPARLSITIKNVARTPVIVVLATPLTDFRIRVVSVSGPEAPRTAFGKRAVAGEVKTKFEGVKLGEGESRTEDLDVSRLFEMKPDTYDVLLARDVYIDGKAVWLSAPIRIQIP